MTMLRGIDENFREEYMGENASTFLISHPGGYFKGTYKPIYLRGFKGTINPQKKTEIQWKGQTKELKWHGQDTLRKINGAAYSMANVGKLVRQRSEREVSIREAHMDGFRPYVVYHPGGIYKGCYKKSHFSGYGVKTFAQKNLIYDGQWKDSKCHGQGTLRKINPDGSSSRLYVGQWIKGKRCGEGKMFHADGIYYGFWKENKRCGLGIMWYTDGGIFIGEWNNGMIHGRGILFYANGSRYEGFFENGMKHGEGLYMHKETGQIQKGMWYQDVCKTSMMFDDFSQEASKPLKYDFKELKLLEPNEVIKRVFKEYMPKPQKIGRKITCSDYILKMRRKLIEVGLTI
ncbi:MORN repeat-containing protein 3 [Eupeodes corollae]|uniref:MORN repeat-containing protein 3 n=1 Tax=Eupeodes corollae TaxID=290404 RepID=UPI0024909EBD|nr:MORN repeat-containing protein 3 [Eupeodes corollae]